MRYRAKVWILRNLRALLGLTLAACGPSAAAPPALPDAVPAATGVRCGFGGLGPAPGVFSVVLVDVRAGAAPLRGVRLAELTLLHPDGGVAGRAGTPLEVRRTDPASTQLLLGDSARFTGIVEAGTTARLLIWVPIDAGWAALGEVGGYRGALATDGLVPLSFSGTGCDGPWPTG